VGELSGPAPYEQWAPIGPGNRVGWVDRGGNLHILTVSDQEDTPMPEQWVPQADWDAAIAEPRDILDDIDAVLAEGEPRTGFDFGDPTFPRCPRGCGRHWHGMAVTVRIEQMAARGVMDLDYRYDEDDSAVLCPAPDFVGPHRPHWAARAGAALPDPWAGRTPFTIEFDANAWLADVAASWRRAHDQLLATIRPVIRDAGEAFRGFAASLAGIGLGDLWQLPDNPFDPSSWLSDTNRYAGWEPLGRLAGPCEYTPIVVENELGYRWSGRHVVSLATMSRTDGLDNRVLFADRSRWMSAEEIVAEMVREHAETGRRTPEDAARAAVESKPIRIAGARPIPRDLADPREQHGPPSSRKRNRRTR
jgi:hypothetical protein